MKSVWAQIENQWQYEEWLPSLFSPEDRSLDLRRCLMTEEEQSALEAMVSTVTVFRGCVADRREGWSWSLDRDTAEWFAQRYAFGGKDGLLLIGRCQKADVIAYFSRRGEEEIVIDPKDVEVVEAVTVSEDNAVEVGPNDEAGAS